MDCYNKQFIKVKIGEGMSDKDIAEQVPYSIADVASVRTSNFMPMFISQPNSMNSLKMLTNK